MDMSKEVSMVAGGKPCKLCGRDNGALSIHFPSYIFRSGDFEAPEWSEHTKYYCPYCEFLWADTFDDLSLADYGKSYVNANYDRHRVPAEERMKRAPVLLRELAALTNGARFIDYGVGYNVPYIYELRGRGVDLWGCDISAMVPYSRFVRYLPAKDLPVGTFDGLYSIDVAEHLSDVVNDYLAMKELLRPGGYMLHVTYWLHALWNPELGPPFNPMLRNPWHVSLCSEKTMHVIAELAGLDFVKSIKADVGPGTAYLLKKRGGTEPKSRWYDRFRKNPIASSVDEHMEYVRKWY